MGRCWDTNYEGCCSFDRFWSEIKMNSPNKIVKHLLSLLIQVLCYSWWGLVYPLKFVSASPLPNTNSIHSYIQLFVCWFRLCRCQPICLITEIYWEIHWNCLSLFVVWNRWSDGILSEQQITFKTIVIIHMMMVSFHSPSTCLHSIRFHWSPLYLAITWKCEDHVMLDKYNNSI